jgi:hypothetical protein
VFGGEVYANGVYDQQLFNTKFHSFSIWPHGIQIFVGEYAARETSRANSWYAAMCEASYMTRLERNKDRTEVN